MKNSTGLVKNTENNTRLGSREPRAKPRDISVIREKKETVEAN